MVTACGIDISKTALAIGQDQAGNITSIGLQWDPIGDELDGEYIIELDGAECRELLQTAGRDLHKALFKHCAARGMFS